jgi:hypothetical protein
VRADRIRRYDDLLKQVVRVFTHAARVATTQPLQPQEQPERHAVILIEWKAAFEELAYDTRPAAVPGLEESFLDLGAHRAVGLSHGVEVGLDRYRLGACSRLATVVAEQDAHTTPSSAHLAVVPGDVPNAGAWWPVAER